jgi:hypothetical protein
MVISSHYSLPNLPRMGLLSSTIRAASFVLATKHRKDMQRVWPLLTYGWGRRRLRDFCLELNQLEATGFIGFHLRPEVHHAVHASCLTRSMVVCKTAESTGGQARNDVVRRRNRREHCFLRKPCRLPGWWEFGADRFPSPHDTGLRSAAKVFQLYLLHTSELTDFTLVRASLLAIGGRRNRSTRS